MAKLFSLAEFIEMIEEEGYNHREQRQWKWQSREDEFDDIVERLLNRFPPDEEEE